jgi:poly(3-hydroxybutyrate) depolymerase
MRRRRAVLAVAGVAVLTIAYAVLAATVFAPANTHGARVRTISFRSHAVDGDQAVGVVIPSRAGSRGNRSLLVFLHGRNETVDTYTSDEAFFEALADLGAKAPIVAFPEGSADSYWHNRGSGDWDDLVIDEVIPIVARRFGADPHRVAIGGISMGGFGAYDLALHNPGRFCAAGGHSPALWLEAGATAPGAFDDAEDFESNDVIAAVRRDPSAFGAIPVWNDAGTEDPFGISDTAFNEALAVGGANLTAHTWPGGHELSYWDHHWGAYLHFYASALAECK